jgi:cytochrome c-type biogenesis protein CcmE
MNPVRKRRLTIALLVLVAGGVAGALVTQALQENLTYLHSPAEVIAGKAPLDSAFRLGGVVLEGSVSNSRIEATREVEYRFVVTDRAYDYPVVYRGVLPDLFREGQSIIARGRIEESVFVAEEVLAKHDESYMPPDVADKITQAQIAKAEELKRAAAASESTTDATHDAPATQGFEGATEASPQSEPAATVNQEG